MAFIEYGGKRHTVPAGEMLIGTGADCHLRLEGPGIVLRHAVLTTAPDLSVSVRKLDPAGAVEVNGVALGTVPQSLLHGDKVTVGGLDLLFVDERKSGSTQYVSAVKLTDLAPPGGRKPGGAQAGKPTAATGGRVVSLTDGREYQVIGGSLKFGRDASSDVVVSGGQVSRRHAEIVQSPRGYIIVDSSTNGTFVNGERVQNQRLLARADILRCGEEEFRFYADAVQPEAGAAPAPAAGPPAPPPPPPPPPPPAPAVSPPGAPAAASSQPGPSGGPVAPQAARSAQLISTGYFPSPPPRPASSTSPRTAEDSALPDVVAPAPPAPPAPPRPAALPSKPPQPPGPLAAQVPPPPAPPPAALPHRAAPIKATAAIPPGVVPKPPGAVPGAPPVSSPPAASAPGQPGQRPSGQTLAKFLVRSGALKGQRLLVKVPIVNIGRADYNDLVIPDDSVSSQHAKLTRREGVWILTDLGSTNGTLVDGERIGGDVPIAPGAFVRFGDVQLVFEPTDDSAGMEKGSGTRAISAVDVRNLKPPAGR